MKLYFTLVYRLLTLLSLSQISQIFRNSTQYTLQSCNPNLKRPLTPVFTHNASVLITYKATGANITVERTSQVGVWCYMTLHFKSSLCIFEKQKENKK